MKTIIFCTIIAIFSIGVSANNAVDILKSNGFEVVTITETNLVLKFDNLLRYNSVYNNDIRREFAKNTVVHEHAPVSRKVEDFVVKNEALVLTPDQVTRLSERHATLKFKPVVFKNNKKGFRIVQWHVGAGYWKYDPIVTHIVLSDAPMTLNENDEDMIMDDEKWVKADESKSLIVDKLGWGVHFELLHFEALKRQNKDIRAYLIENPVYLKIWTKLVEHGLMEPFDEIETKSDDPKTN